MKLKWRGLQFEDKNIYPFVVRRFVADYGGLLERWKRRLSG